MKGISKQSHCRALSTSNNDEQLVTIGDLGRTATKFDVAQILWKFCSSKSKCSQPTLSDKRTTKIQFFKLEQKQCDCLSDNLDMYNF